MARVFVIIYMVSSQRVKEVKIKKSNLWEKCNVFRVFTMFIYLFVECMFFIAGTTTPLGNDCPFDIHTRDAPQSS